MFLPLFNTDQICGQVVSFYLQSRFPSVEAVHLSAELPQLLLVDVAQSTRLLAPQLVEFCHQNLILLLQEAHFLDVAGEAVVQPHHLHLLVGAGLPVLGLQEGVRREVQPLSTQGQARGGKRHWAGGEVPRAAVEGQAARAEAAGDPRGRGASRSTEALSVGRVNTLGLHG